MGRFLSLLSSAPTIEKTSFAVEPFEGEVEKENSAEGGSEAEETEACPFVSHDPCELADAEDGDEEEGGGAAGFIDDEGSEGCAEGDDGCGGEPVFINPGLDSA